MIQLLQYRGREVTDADAAFLRELIACHPQASRRALSRLACQAWNWVQPNGALRDMVCRGLMLALHRSGHLVLPAPRYIHTCELNDANAFHYLTTLQKHAAELAATPGDWMPWNYLHTLESSPSRPAG